MKSLTSVIKCAGTSKLPGLDLQGYHKQCLETYAGVLNELFIPTNCFQRTQTRLDAFQLENEC